MLLTLKSKATQKLEFTLIIKWKYLVDLFDYVRKPYTIILLCRSLVSRFVCAKSNPIKRSWISQGWSITRWTWFDSITNTNRRKWRSIICHKYRYNECHCPYDGLHLRSDKNIVFVPNKHGKTEYCWFVLQLVDETVSPWTSDANHVSTPPQSAYKHSDLFVRWLR